MKKIKIIDGLLILTICLIIMFALSPILSINVINLRPTGTNLSLLLKNISSIMKLWQLMLIPAKLSAIALLMTMFFAVSILVLTILSKIKNKKILNILSLVSFIGFFVCFNLFFMAYFSRNNFGFSLALFFKYASVFGYLIEILAILGICLSAININSDLKTNENASERKYKGMRTL